VWDVGRAKSSLARREPFGEPGQVAAHGDHDLVGRERGQRVCDRKQRIGVADAAFCVNTASFEPLEVGRDPFLRAAASCVFVRQPVPKPVASSSLILAALTQRSTSRLHGI
jgi:hypothetical protein